MAAVASPTPLAFSTGASEFRRPTRPASQTARYSRPYAHRSAFVPVPATKIKEGSGDSSDDDDLAPIKLSAEAQAILGEDNSQAGTDKENVNIYARRKSPLQEVNEGDAGSNNRIRSVASTTQYNGSPAQRVIRLGQSRPALTAVGRDGSFMYKTHDKTNMQPQQADTPPSRKRVIRIGEGRRLSRSPLSSHSGASHGENNKQYAENERQVAESPQHTEGNSPVKDMNAGPSTVTRPRKGEENAGHSTMRVRRIGVGSMLGRPVRRGMIRRPSEDDEPHPEREPSLSPEIEIGRRAREPDMQDLPDLAMSPSRSPKLAVHDFASHHMKASVAVTSRRTGSPEPRSPVRQPILSTSLHRSKPTPVSNGSHPSTRSSSSQRKPIFKIPSLPALSPNREQENIPPPTFKKSKPSAPILVIHDDNAESAQKEVVATEVASPARQPLAPRSNNTPHRPAPAPPPRMSLVEAATSNPNGRKKTTVSVLVNKNPYKRLDCVGRGGSSRVYRVMAENYKIFALKKVSLEDADEAAVVGYKGEIDLLRKLEKVERVIQLIDYEINNDKGTLSVLMELGETDFNKMLNEQCKGDGARLDVTFTRHYWKEMLECVAAVHAHGIVHSDLKPANFLLVKGQLKLIDFGIANAIQDNTVNVHRENQIGTPNYMSPESLICQHVSTDVPGQQIKDIKLGRPSDVWSLGCILYQMTYGQPPFAHITQQMQRIMSIPNPKVEIAFPARGIGGVVVPFGLIKTLRRCLTREQSLRPTLAELLDEGDPFLNPVAISPDMLGRVIGNVVSYCRRREENMKKDGWDGEGSALPRDDEMKGWPEAFYTKLRQAQKEGTAW